MNKLKHFFEKIFTKIYCIFLPERVSTSLSDNQSYPQICLDASNHFRYFNKFRRNFIYRSIVETVTHDLGKKYIEVIGEDNDIIGQLNNFKKNDEWGGPFLSDYEKWGKISPTTIRYIKVGQDLKSNLKNLTDFDVCEIGVGYGGQCRILDAIFNFKTYTLVDIQPALQLSKQYLGNFILKTEIIFKTMNELSSTREYDLCISNYAFSELPREIQDVYLKKVILKSKNGYITYSDNFTPDHFNSYKINELLKTIPGSRLIEEKPKTGPNYIIVW